MGIINPLKFDYTRKRPSYGEQRRGLLRVGTKIGKRDIRLGAKTINVFPGQNIQTAIDALDKDGGGIVFLKIGTHKPVYNISGKDGVSIIGEGRDLTIIDFKGGAYGLDYTGTSGTIMENFKLADFTLKNSNNTAGIAIDYCDFFKIENVRTSSCDQKGLRVRYSRNFMMDNVLSANNTGNGFEFVGDGNRSQFVFSLINCRSSNNDIGFSFSGNDQYNYSLVQCSADNNSGDGFDFAGAIAVAATIVGGRSDANGGNGYDIDVKSIVFIGCLSDLNTGDGFETSQLNIRLIGVRSNGNGTEYDLNISTTVIGCAIPFGSSVVPSDEFSETDTINSQFFGNLGGNVKTTKETARMKNTSGGSVVKGNITTFKAAANGDEITTSTTQGDDLVFGMVLENHNNNEYTPILTKGYTKLLKVNGATAISIGDFIGVSGTAGIGMKAAAGDTVIAIALEAYSGADDNGIIDALVISPRRI